MPNLDDAEIQALVAAVAVLSRHAPLLAHLVAELVEQATPGDHTE